MSATDNSCKLVSAVIASEILINSMYTKEQASKIRSQFWMRFGQYMKPVPGSGGDMVNWLNYKTGVRNIFFHMDVNEEGATVAIEIKHPDDVERERYYQQFLALGKLLEEVTGFAWQWENARFLTGEKTYSIIYQSLSEVNVLQENNWPKIIEFLKLRIIALDKFWNLVKDGFE